MSQIAIIIVAGKAFEYLQGQGLIKSIENNELENIDTEVGAGDVATSSEYFTAMGVPAIK